MANVMYIIMFNSVKVHILYALMHTYLSYMKCITMATSRIEIED